MSIQRLKVIDIPDVQTYLQNGLLFTDEYFNGVLKYVKTEAECSMIMNHRHSFSVFYPHENIKLYFLS